ncbi:hypothetical protein [Aeromonas salmonicida]|nr:hypothetical protein [Aeromonas salmonicida]
MSIQVQGLNKHFNQYAALADINLDFHDGELVARQAQLYPDYQI